MNDTNELNASAPLSARPPGWMRGLRRTEGVVAVLTAVLLASLMAITVVDVTGRYAFNHPLSGAAEWVELAMGLMIFGGIFQATVRSEHIRIDLFDKGWSPAARQIIQAIGRAVSAVVLALVTWRLLLKAADLHRYDDVSAYLGVALAPLGVIMAVAAALSAVVCLLQLRWPAAFDGQGSSVGER